MEYYLHLFILILIYTILVQGLNYNFGLGGIFNLAHVACYSVGAYTTAILSNYKKQIDHYISEKDQGLYHAMNKGIRAANGEFLLFLNAGDRFLNDSVLSEIDSL